MNVPSAVPAFETISLACSLVMVPCNHADPVGVSILPIVSGSAAVVAAAAANTSDGIANDICIYIIIEKKFKEYRRKIITSMNMQLKHIGELNGAQASHDQKIVCFQPGLYL